MIPDIKITKDEKNIYGVGKIVNANTLLMDYKKRENAAHNYGWLCCIPMPSAIKYMAEDLGLEYVIC